uniref:Uncharacterized protein n=1 Tax=Plectus sambesii TaxID=2011161 RepID=A0A914XH63_9BILA
MDTHTLAIVDGATRAVVDTRMFGDRRTCVAIIDASVHWTVDQITRCTEHFWHSVHRTGLGPTCFSMDRANSVRSRVALHGKNLQKEVDGPDRGPTVFSAGPRYLVLDRGIKCWTGPGPGPT